MQEIKKAMSLPKLGYYETHLSLVNCILPIKMTPKEIEVLAAFMSLEVGELPAQRFSTPCKKYVKSQLNLSPQGLSNYFNSLVEKGFIYKGENYEILPLLIPEKEQQDYRFRLKLDYNEQDKAKKKKEPKYILTE